jgi:hypothetical protein
LNQAGLNFKAEGTVKTPEMIRPINTREVVVSIEKTLKKSILAKMGNIGAWAKQRWL